MIKWVVFGLDSSVERVISNYLIRLIYPQSLWHGLNGSVDK